MIIAASPSKTPATGITPESIHEKTSPEGPASSAKDDTTPKRPETPGFYPGT